MNAQTQYKLSAADLELVLALVRGGTLQDAGERLAVDASTVFRAIQRIERGLGQRLFERSRMGYQPLELAQALARHAEQVEVELESARSAAQLQPEDVSGTVRITTTDSLLHGLLAPALKPLRQLHPRLSFELHAGHELANLTRRDTDIAVRATKRPPPHLVGKQVGVLKLALFAARQSAWRSLDQVKASQAPWIAVDDVLPEHPSVLWRKRCLPKVAPTYRVTSILTVMELVSLNMGVGILPLFLAQGRQELVQVTEELEDCRTELWLLTHTESRHLRRVSTVYGHLARELALDQA
ncbi:LysR family transcriptional regulator [Aquabacterium sp.]|uniref:LysR family transcriptional regulator n=1 Tax=Aquabacterium sp. TaxID=1872578 RepID=UPI003D6C9CAC